MSEPEGIPDFIPLEDDPTGLSSLFAQYGQANPQESVPGVPFVLPKPVPMDSPKPGPEAPTQSFSLKADTIDAAALGHWTAKKQSALNDLANIMQEASRDEAGEIPDTFENAGRNMGGVSGKLATITKVDRMTRAARRSTQIIAIQQELALADQGIKANTRADQAELEPNMANRIFQGAEPMAQAIAPQVAAWGIGLLGAPETLGTSMLLPLGAAVASGGIMGKHAYDATAAQALLQYGADKGVDITTPQGMRVAMSDPDFVAYRERLALKVGAISTVAGTALGVAPGGAQVLTKAATGNALAKSALSSTTQNVLSSAAGQTAGLGTAVSIGAGQQVATNYVSGDPLGKGVADSAAQFAVQDLILRMLHGGGGKAYDYYKQFRSGTNVGAPGAGPKPGPQPEQGTRAPGSGPGEGSALSADQYAALVAEGMPDTLTREQQIDWIKSNRDALRRAFEKLASRTDARSGSQTQETPAAQPVEPSAPAEPVAPVAAAPAPAAPAPSVADVVIPPAPQATSQPSSGNVPSYPRFGTTEQKLDWFVKYNKTHDHDGLPLNLPPSSVADVVIPPAPPSPAASSDTHDFIPLEDGTALSARDEAQPAGKVTDEMIIRGAYKMPKFEGDYEAWANDMITDFGPEIEASLPDIFDRGLPIRKKMDEYSAKMSGSVDKAGNLRKRDTYRDQTGLPLNPLVQFADEQGKPYFVGGLGKNRGVDDGKPTDAFIKEVEAFVPPEKMKEFFQWYERVAPQFIQTFGSLDKPENGIRMMTAWLAAQQNEGPSGALRNVFRKEDQLAGFKDFTSKDGETKENLKAGLADGKVGSILQDQVPEGGFGAKLTDFSFGSGTGRVTREYMGHDASAGAPFVADVWTGRDYGFLDSQTLNRLIEKAKDGKLTLAGLNGKDGGGKPVKITPSLVTVRRIEKVSGGKPKDNVVASDVTPEEAKAFIAQIEGEKNPKVTAKVVVQQVNVKSGRKSVTLDADLAGSPADAQYERAADWGNRVTADLNKMGYQGRKWVPSEVQALGWMAKMKQYGEAEATGSDAFRENTSRIAQTPDFSEGGMIASSHPEVASLPPEARAQVAKDVVETSARELAEIIGGSLRIVGTTQGQAITAEGMAPSVVIQALGSPESKGMLASALALVGKQASVTTVEFGPGGANSRTVHFSKPDGSVFTQDEKSALGALIGPGLSFHEFDGVERALITRANGKSLTETMAEKALAKLGQWANDAGVDIEADHTPTSINHAENNWQSDKEGRPYQEAIVARGGSSRLRSILDYRQRYEAVVREAVERARSGGSEEVAQSARDTAPEADSARDEVDRKAAELDRRIEARRQAQERNTNPETARRGNEQIAQRLVNELRNGGKLTHQEVSAALRIVEKLMENGYLDNLKVSVSVANPGEAVRGGYEPASELVKLFVRNTNRPGVFRHTFTHEVAHHLERMIPAKDLEAARQQFLRERAKWLKDKQGLRELLGEGNWLDRTFSNDEIKQFLAGNTMNPELISKYFIRDTGTGRWRIKRTDETYRLTNFSEFFADNVADLASARDEARTNPQDPIGVWARIKSFFAGIKKVLTDAFGQDKVAKIWDKFQRGEYTSDFKRDKLHGYDRRRNTNPVEDDVRTADYRERRMGPADQDRQTRVDNIDQLEPNKPIPRTRSARDNEGYFAGQAREQRAQLKQLEAETAALHAAAKEAEGSGRGYDLVRLREARRDLDTHYRKMATLRKNIEENETFARAADDSQSSQSVRDEQPSHPLTIPEEAYRKPAAGFVHVDIDPAKINQAHADDPSSLRDPRNQLTSGGRSRVERAKEFLKEKRWSREGATSPMLGFGENGKLAITDGRHRLLAAEQLGMPSMKAQVPEDQADEISRRFGHDTGMVESARDDGENTPIPGGYREAFFQAKKGAGAPEPKQIKFWTDIGHDVEADQTKQFLWAIDKRGELQVISMKDLNEMADTPWNKSSGEEWTRSATHLDWEEIGGHFGLLSGPAHGRIDATDDVVRISVVQKNQNNPAMKADMQSYVKGKLSEIMGVEPDQARGYDFTDAGPFDGPTVFSARDEETPEVPRPSRPGSFKAFDEMVTGREIPKPEGMPYPYNLKRFTTLAPASQTARKNLAGYHLVQQGSDLGPAGKDERREFRAVSKDVNPVSGKPIDEYRILFQYAQSGSRGSKGSIYVTIVDDVSGETPDSVKTGLISELFERARQAGIKDITLDKTYAGKMSPEEVGLWGHVAKNEPDINYTGELNTYGIDKKTAYSARDEEPEQAPMSVEQRKARIEEIKREILPLANKGNLTREEGARYSKLGMELETHRFEMRAGRGLKLELIKPMQERGSAIPSEIVKIASDELASSKPAFEALTEASLGVGLNQDTAVDGIMNGQNSNLSPEGLYSAFNRTREALRNQFGDTIVLYRAHGKQKQKATQNWHSTEAGAREYGSNIERREIPVDDIIAMNVGLRGAYEEFIVGKKPVSADQDTALSARDEEQAGPEFTTPGGELTNHGDKALANGGFMTREALRIPENERSRYTFAFAKDERNGGYSAQIKYDGKPVGNLDLSSEEYENGKGLVSLDMIDVDPKFQGKGLSTILQAEVYELGKRANPPVDTAVATVLDPKVRPLKSMQKLLGKDNVDILESTTEATDENDGFGYVGSNDDLVEMAERDGVDFYERGQKFRDRREIQGNIPQYTPEQRQLIKDIEAARAGGDTAKASRLKAQFDQSVKDNGTQILSARDEDGENTIIPGGKREKFLKSKPAARPQYYTEIGHDPANAENSYLFMVDVDGVMSVKRVSDLQAEVRKELAFNDETGVYDMENKPYGFSIDELTHNDWEDMDNRFGDGSIKSGSRDAIAFGRIEVKDGKPYIAVGGQGDGGSDIAYNEGKKAFRQIIRDAAQQAIDSGEISNVTQRSVGLDYSFVDGGDSGKPAVFSARDEEAPANPPALPEVSTPKGGLIAAVAAMTPTAAEAASRAGSVVSAVTNMDLVSAAAAITLAGNDRLLTGLNPIVANMHLLARDTQSPTIRSVAEMFNRLGGNVAEGAQETYFEERDGNRRMLRNKLVEAFKPLAHLSEADLKALDQDIAMALAGEKTLTGPEGQVVANLQAFSDELFDYLREAGVKVNYAKDYGMPHSFNSEQVLTNEQAFLADATRAYQVNNPMRIKRLTDYIQQIQNQAAARGGMTAEMVERQAELNKEINELQNAKPAEQAQALLEAIDTSNAGGDSTQGLLLEARGTGQNKADFTRERIFEPAARRILRDYFNNDPRHAWNSYIARATTLAEFARRFGGDGSKWTGMVRQMRAENVSNKDITRIKNMVLDSLGVLNSAPTEGHALAVSMLGLSNMAKLKSTALTNFLEAQAQAIPGHLGHTVSAPVNMLGQFMAIVTELSPRQQAQLKNLIGLEISTETGAMELARAVGLIDAAGVHEMMENSAFNLERASDYAGATKSDKLARGVSNATGALARAYGIEASENAKRAMATKYAANRLDAHVSEFLRDGLFARAWDKLHQNNPNPPVNPFTLRNEAVMRLRRAGVSDAQMQAFAQWWETARASDFNAAIKGNDPMAKLARKVIRMETARASVNTNRAMKPGGKENPLVSQDTFAGKALMTFLNYPATFREQIGKPMMRDIKTAARGYESEGGQSTYYSGFERARMGARAMAIPAMAVSAAVFLALRAWATGHEDDVKEKPLWKHLIEGLTYTGIAGGKSEFASRVSRGQLPPILDEGNRLVRDMNRNDDKKNSKERAVTEGVLRGGVVPGALGFSSTFLPVPMAAVVNQALASKTFREAATDFIAGPAAPKKQGQPGAREGGSSKGREGESRPGSR
jgi:GNAT superfamily N-acetyltransferase